MSRYFLPQRNELTQEERGKLTDEKISELNRYLSQQKGDFAQTYGIDLSDPNASAERPGRTPRAFLLKDGKVSTLQENNIKPGSREFWESAMKGQLFAYPLGEKDPVQLQAWIGLAGPVFESSGPLIPGKEVPFPEEPATPKPPTEPKQPTYPEMEHPKPDPVPEPGEEPPRPGVFTRIAAFFGRKASKEKIARHNEWTQNCTLFEEYQVKLQEHLEEKESLDETYLTRVGNYQKMIGQHVINVESYKVQSELYEVNHKAWEAEDTQKDMLRQAREASGQIIANTFGASRTEEVLQAEKEEEKIRSKLEMANSAYKHGEAGFQNGMTLFAPKPRIKEEWIQRGRYGKADFEKLSEIKLDGMTVGTEPKQVTDEEYAALAAFANLTRENGLKIAKISSPPLIDAEGTARAFEEIGYTREEFSDLLIGQAVPAVIQDVMQFDHPRNPMGQYFEDFLEPARQRAGKALQDYQKGNKQELAEILSRGMEFADQTARMGADFNETTQAVTRMASHAAALMERDPELKAMATEAYEKRENAMHERHKDFAGPRSMEDILNNLKNYEKLRDLQTKECAAREKLVRNQTGELKLSDAEKKDCLRDIMRHMAIRASYYVQVSKKNDKSTVYALDIQEQITEKYGKVDTMLPLTKNFSTYIQQYYVPKAPEGEPAVLDMLSDEKWLGSINKAVETTIQNGLQTSGDNLDKLCDRVLSGSDNVNGDPAYHRSTNFLKTMAQAKEALDAAKQPEQVKTTVLEQGKKIEEQVKEQPGGPEAT